MKDTCCYHYGICKTTTPAGHKLTQLRHTDHFEIFCQSFCSFKIAISSHNSITYNPQHIVKKELLCELINQPVQEIILPESDGSTKYDMMKVLYQHVKTNVPIGHRIKLKHHGDHYSILCQSFCKFNIYLNNRSEIKCYLRHEVQREVLQSILDNEGEILDESVRFAPKRKIEDDKREVKETKVDFKKSAGEGDRGKNTPQSPILEFVSNFFC